MTRIDTLLLDADGVIQQPASGWLDEVAQLCTEPLSPQNFLAQLFEAEKPCLRGAADWPEVLDSLLRAHNSPATLEQALAIWTRIEPADEILNLLPSLRVPVALATNQQPHRAAFMRDALGYGDRFDHLFISCEMGCCKPEHEYFAAIATTLDHDPATLLFIDDHPENVAAARNCGLQAEQFHLDAGADGLFRLLRSYDLL